jgi:hypothetical protein
MTNKEFIINTLINSMNDRYSRNNFTVSRIIDALSKSNKIEENEDKLNEFLLLKTKRGIIKDNIDYYENKKLTELSRELYIDGDTTLWEKWQIDNVKLITSGNYELLFALDPLSYNEYDARNLIKIIYCDDNIFDKLKNVGRGDEMSCYYNLFPRKIHSSSVKDDLSKMFMILKGEMQVWETNGDFDICTDMNEYLASTINNIKTYYILDSKISYPNNKEIIEYLSLNEKDDKLPDYYKKEFMGPHQYRGDANLGRL